MHLISRFPQFLWMAIPTCLFMVGCAMKVGPTGGPKDAIPAEITSVEPPSGTTALKSRSITFGFDDYVDRAVSNAVTILPNARFSTSYAGDEMVVTFEDSLEANTTYTITLGTEWSDLRGNKPTRSYTAVYSTGDHIDTGYIAGQVYGSSLVNVAIFCYQRADTLEASFTPRSTRPKFRLPVGSSGEFSVMGLPDGLYRISAVSDNNRNSLIDNDEDFVNAHSDILITNGGAQPLSLLMGRALDRDPPSLARVRVLNKRLVTVQFSESVLPVTGWHSALSIWNASDSAVPVAAMWLDKLPGDMLMVRLQKDIDTSRHILRLTPRSVVDSTGLMSADTIARMVFRGSRSLDTTSFRVLRITPPDSARQVRADTTVVIRFSDAVDTSNARMTIWHHSPQGASPVVATWADAVTLVLRPAQTRTIKSWYGTSITFGEVRSMLGASLIDTTLQHSMLTEDRPNELGLVKGVVIDTFRLAPSQGAMMLRFLHSNRHVVASVTVVPGVAFEVDQLPQGEYTMDVFVNSNNNGVYDHGDHSPFAPGEHWWPSPSTVIVRARWTVDNLRVVFGTKP